MRTNVKWYFFSKVESLVWMGYKWRKRTVTINRWMKKNYNFLNFQIEKSECQECAYISRNLIGMICLCRENATKCALHIWFSDIHNRAAFSRIKMKFFSRKIELFTQYCWAIKLFICSRCWFNLEIIQKLDRNSSHFPLLITIQTVKPFYCSNYQFTVLIVSSVSVLFKLIRIH